MAGETLGVDVTVAGREAAAPRLVARFAAPPGITVLFGPSGSGKSTCLAAIAGLLRPARGVIRLGGERLFDAAAGIDVPPDRRGVALVFQSLALFPHLTALDNVAYGLGRDRPRRERRERALAWLERVHVGHLAARRPGTFSGGEAQRVALARALASAPRVLLLDEPFSSLDAPLRRRLREELAGLVAELGGPAILVTHDAEEARLLGSRMVALRAGALVGEGTPDEILALRSA
jgi:molybdate transport system ATP-binding protein